MHATIKNLLKRFTSRTDESKFERLLTLTNVVSVTRDEYGTLNEPDATEGNPRIGPPFPQSHTEEVDFETDNIITINLNN